MILRLFCSGRGVSGWKRARASGAGVDDAALMPAAARGQGEQAEQDTKRNQKTRE